MEKMISFEGVIAFIVLGVLSLIGRWTLESRDNSRRVITAVFGDEQLPGALTRITTLEDSKQHVERDLLTISTTLYGRRGDNGLVSDVAHLMGRPLE